MDETTVATTDACWVGQMVASTAANWVALLGALSVVVMVDLKAGWREFSRVACSVAH